MGHIKWPAPDQACANFSLPPPRKRYDRAFSPPTQYRARSSSPSWSSQLTLILLHLRATPRDELLCSPAEAVYGAQLVLPGQTTGTPEPPDSFFMQLGVDMSSFQPVQAAYAQPTTPPPQAPPPLELMTATCAARRPPWPLRMHVGWSLQQTAAL